MRVLGVVAGGVLAFSGAAATAHAQVSGPVDRIAIVRSVLTYIETRSEREHGGMPLYLLAESPVVKFIDRSDGRLSVDGRDAPRPVLWTDVLDGLLTGTKVRTEPIPADVSGCEGPRATSRCSAAISHMVLTITQPWLPNADEAFVSVTSSIYKRGRVRPFGQEEAFRLRRQSDGHWVVVQVDATGVM